MSHTIYRVGIVPDGDGKVEEGVRIIKKNVPYHSVQGIAEREAFVIGLGSDVTDAPDVDRLKFYDPEKRYTIYCYEVRPKRRNFFSSFFGS